MAIIYEILELADDQGRGTGKFRHVSYSDEASDPIYTPLLEKTFDSREAAASDPDAMDALDRIFHRGKYAPRDARDDLIAQLGSALAKARRALQIAEGRLQVMLRLPDEADFRAYVDGGSAADVGCGAYYAWREQEGLLTAREIETRMVDPQ